jgi:hypothetical protein
MSSRFYGGFGWTIAGLAICLFILAAPTSTQAKSRSWDFNLGVGVGYNNNILNYSDANLNELDTMTADTAGEFSIKSPNDFIISPTAGAIFKTKAFHHALHVGFDAGYNLYTKNSIRNFGSLGLSLKEYLRKETYIQLSTSYIPEFYYRNLYATGIGYRKARYSKIGLGLKLAFPINKIFSGALSYGYDNRDFNSILNERDQKVNNFSAELSYQPRHLYKVWGGYQFSIARSAGRYNRLDRRDSSYDSFLFWVGSRVFLKGLANKQMNAGATVAYKDVLFQTDKLFAEDRYRFGRIDKRWSVTFDVGQKISPKSSVIFQVIRLQNDADLPAIELKPFLDYSSTSAKIIFDYSF